MNNHNCKKGYGERIKACRANAGLSQSELGSIIGVTGVTIMRYEKELREPKFEVFKALADALLTNPAYLAGYINDPNAPMPKGMDLIWEFDEYDDKRVLNESMLHAYENSLVAQDTVDLGLLALEIKKRQNCTVEEAEQIAEVIAKCIQSKNLSDVLVLFDSASPELQQLVIAALKPGKE